MELSIDFQLTTMATGIPEQIESTVDFKVHRPVITIDQETVAESNLDYESSHLDINLIDQLSEPLIQSTTLPQNDIDDGEIAGPSCSLDSDIPGSYSLNLEDADNVSKDLHIYLFKVFLSALSPTFHPA